MSTMPLIVGSSNVIAGTPGAEKSKWIKRWVSKIWGQKVIIKTERSNERSEANAYGPDQITETWDIGGVESPSDLVVFVEFALRTIVLRAPYLKGNLTVLMDSITAYIQALDFVLESTGKTKSGGLPTEVLEELWPLLVSMARHSEHGSAITLLLVHAVSDSMTEGVLGFMKSKCDSKIILRDGYNIPYLPLVLNRELGVYGTLFRKVEDVVGEETASWLFALYNTENHSQPQNEAAMKIRMNREQWQAYAEHVRRIWDRPWNPHRFPNRMKEILAEIWRNWPTVMGYKGQSHIFPEEIRREAEVLLGLREPEEVKRSPNGQPREEVVPAEVPAPIIHENGHAAKPAPQPTPVVPFTAADAAEADERARRLAEQWAQPAGDPEAAKAVQRWLKRSSESEGGAK
jgi:hypothetical protein